MLEREIGGGKTEKERANPRSLPALGGEGGREREPALGPLFTLNRAGSRSLPLLESERAKARVER